MKNKSIIFILLLGVVILVIAGVLVFLAISHDVFKSRKSYSEAEKYSINYLNSDTEQLTKIAKKVIKEKSSDSVSTKIKDIQSIHYGGGNFMTNGNYVTFTFYDNGFYHDVDWGLIYSPANNFAGEDELYTYDESINDSEGNNVYVRKKIKDNWFFYYNDYDGDTKLNEITK